jgi:1-aminocyclopropane-1-carboxylate deaminase/D-cysteine desulfhydrase-like pyridoxal-dependent ACC family enzyme
MPASLGVPPVEVLVEEASGHLGRKISIRPGDVRILYEHAGRAYGSPTPESIDAIRMLARTEGIFLDPVYTSKAMAGLLSLCRQGAVRAGESVIFVHTGGTPALFAYGEALA